MRLQRLLRPGLGLTPLGAAVIATTWFVPAVCFGLDGGGLQAAGVLLSRIAGDRAAFYLQPSHIIHANTCSTVGCLEHIEHGHDVPGCLDAHASSISSTSPADRGSRRRG